MLDVYKDLYDRRNESPLWWYDKSSDLHASCGIIWVCLSGEMEEEVKYDSGFLMDFTWGLLVGPCI